MLKAIRAAGVSLCGACSELVCLPHLLNRASGHGCFYPFDEMLFVHREKNDSIRVTQDPCDEKHANPKEPVIRYTDNSVTYCTSSFHTGK